MHLLRNSPQIQGFTAANVTNRFSLSFETERQSWRALQRLPKLVQRMKWLMLAASVLLTYTT